MIRLNDKLLVELGFGRLPANLRSYTLAGLYAALESRVGITLADQMSNRQLSEFKDFIDAKDNDGAFKWLETNLPNYKVVVHAEYERLVAEISKATTWLVPMTSL